MNQHNARTFLRHAALGAALALGMGVFAGSAPAYAAGMDVRLQDDKDPGSPVRGGRLSVLIRLDATSLDPHTAIETSAYVIVEQIYESLVESVRGETRPAIAERWEVSPDGLTYTFHLRNNAMFHSGKPVTAADVKYSIERIRNPATASPRARSFDSIASIETPAERTVVFKLSRPYAPFLSLMSTNGASIVDRSVIEGAGLNGNVDAGSGPFMLRQRVVGQRFVLDRSPSYWNQPLPYLDGIDVTFNPDDNARAAAVRSNTVNFLWRAAPEFIDAMKRDPELKWYGGPGSLSLHLRLNTGRKPFDDVRVRQAIYLAMDRQEILEIANSGHGMPLNAGYLPPDRWGSIKQPIYGEPNIAKAKALLAEAGFPNGFSTKLMVISTSAFQTRSAEVEQQQLAKIGIKVELNLVEATVANAAMRQNNFDMYQSGFSLSLDPDERFSSAFVTDGGTNYGNWSDAEYDKLVVEARAETDRAKREKLYQRTEEILATRGPVAMTWVSADYDVVRKNVMGYVGDPTPSYRFYRQLWLAR
jgi:peptide/nickel transport system substrate-binding protein